jgi:hypothetical protein
MSNKSKGRKTINTQSIIIREFLPANHPICSNLCKPPNKTHSAYRVICGHAERCKKFELIYVKPLIGAEQNGALISALILQMSIYFMEYLVPHFFRFLSFF